ncbi:MAG: CAP domain-containing protein [Candidatus Methanoperedens sp.]
MGTLDRYPDWKDIDNEKIHSSHMCYFCEKIENIPFKCPHCNKYFCAKHHLPESHNCIGNFRNFNNGSWFKNKRREKILWDWTPKKVHESHKSPYIKTPHFTQKTKISHRSIKRWLSNILILIIVLGLVIVFALMVYSSVNGKDKGITENSPATLGNITESINNFKSFIHTINENYGNGNSSDRILQDLNVKQSEINSSKLELRIHELINKQRQNNGVVELSFDSKLEVIAQKHSQDMASNNFFEHINLKGEDPTRRGADIGYICRKDYGSYYTNGIAENLFQNNLYDSVTYYNGIPVYNWNSFEEIAQSTVNGWMNSPGHRQNILKPTYDREGIGIAISSDDKVLITEDFC